ncbi:MAG: hypothetical protein V4515_06360 [Chloroflexota bacterium]
MSLPEAETRTQMMDSVVQRAAACGPQAEFRRMNRHLTGAKKARRLASIVLGSLAIVALAASPALAHARISTADTVRHNLLASEFAGAEDTEVVDLESLLDTEDGDNQGDNSDATDGPDDQGDQADNANDGPDEIDGSNNQDESSDTSDTSGDSGSHDSGGDSGGDGGLDGGPDGGD